MNTVIFVEGGSIGPHSKALNTACRKGFRELLERCGFVRLPALVACGLWANSFRDFKKESRSSSRAEFVAMWIDSEEPLKDTEDTWAHLKTRDNWTRPDGVTDVQVLLMTTCMETLIVSDREALRDHYRSKLQESALPPIENLEQRHRHDVQERLSHATRACSNPYTKGKSWFEVLGKLSPTTLEQHLPSFKRTKRILISKL